MLVDWREYGKVVQSVDTSVDMMDVQLVELLADEMDDGMVVL